MVRIRLRRIGTKARPFYRIVVAKSQAGRNGAFVETIGTYDPTRKEKLIEVNEERALHWLMAGAQPSETTAYILNKSGVLPKFLDQRPKQKGNFKFLDKRTAATSVASSVDVPAAPVAVAEPEPVAAAPAPAPEPEAPVAEPVAEAPAIEETAPEATPEPEAESAATE
jgi:small subunit ribosomal protein S16